MSETKNGPQGGLVEEVHHRLRKAGNSYAVTIPTGWISEGGWDHKGTLRLRRFRPDSIIIDEPWNPTGEKVTLTTAQEDSHVFRELLGAYLQGYTDIQLELPGATQPKSRAVREFVRRTGTMMVASETLGRTEIRDLGTPDVPLSSRLDRMHSIAVEMHKLVSARWSDLPFASQTQVAKRDDEVDRLGWQIRRHLARYGDHGNRISAREAIPVLLLSRTWERIADLAVRIEEEQEAMAEASPPPSLLAHVYNLHQRTIESLSTGPQILASRNVEAANEYVDSVGAAEAERSALLLEAVRLAKAGKLASEGLAGISVVLESLVRMSRYLADVGELVMDTPAGTFEDHRQPNMKERATTAARRTLNERSNTPVRSGA
ncbi:MAG: phosphate uptake regulator PhoU [Nitrososphaerota archaeon]|nr:phosphate uptake regulator PhoU [Nitrososphaerota archaeon]